MRAPESHRRHSRSLFEKFAEARLVAEVEVVGNALHRVTRDEQFALNACHDKLRYYILCGAVCSLACNFVQIFRRDAEFVGIESHIVLLASMLVEKLYEVDKIGVG